MGGAMQLNREYLYEIYQHIDKHAYDTCIPQSRQAVDLRLVRVTGIARTGGGQKAPEKQPVEQHDQWLDHD